MNELPTHLQDVVQTFGEYSYGAYRIIVKLDDGREFSDVFVAWGKEIIKVEGYESLPFDPKRIVEVRNQ